MAFTTLPKPTTVFSSVAKPTLPATVWGAFANFWDEEDLFWDSSGYADIDKPSSPVYTSINKPI